MKEVFIMLVLSLSGICPGSAQTITVINDQNLNFGNFFQVSDTGGTVTLLNTGTRTSAGDITVIGTSYFCSVFTITTNHSTPVTLTIDQPTAILSGSNGGTLKLEIGPASPNLPTVSSEAPVEIHIGGTLTIRSQNENPPGNYTGNVLIGFTVNNQ